MALKYIIKVHDHGKRELKAKLENILPDAADRDALLLADQMIYRICAGSEKSQCQKNGSKKHG